MGQMRRFVNDARIEGIFLIEFSLSPNVVCRKLLRTFDDTLKVVHITQAKRRQRTSFVPSIYRLGNWKGKLLLHDGAPHCADVDISHFTHTKRPNESEMCGKYFQTPHVIASESCDNSERQFLEHWGDVWKFFNSIFLFCCDPKMRREKFSVCLFFLLRYYCVDVIERGKFVIGDDKIHQALLPFFSFS